jgi:peptide/nickel transport system permease protein
MPDADLDDAPALEPTPSGALVPEPAAALDAGFSPKQGFGLGFWISVGWLVFVLGLLAVVPLLPLDDPNEFTADLNLSPSGSHLFGTNQNGNDMLSRVLWGGRISFLIGVCALVLGFIIGGAIGITAGYFRGTYERLIMGLMDILLSFPSLILAIGLIAVLSDPGTTQGSFPKVVFVLTVLSVPALARITRANTLVYSRREFVTAARSLGARNGRILVREILPNVLPSMLSFAFIALAVLVIAEGALAALGLSVETPTVTLGKIINDGRVRIEDYPYLSLFPCGFLFLTLLALNMIGDRLQARFSVKEGQV